MSNMAVTEVPSWFKKHWKDDFIQYTEKWNTNLDSSVAELLKIQILGKLAPLFAQFELVSKKTTSSKIEVYEKCVKLDKICAQAIVALHQRIYFSSHAVAVFRSYPRIHEERIANLASVHLDLICDVYDQSFFVSPMGKVRFSAGLLGEHIKNLGPVTTSGEFILRVIERIDATKNMDVQTHLGVDLIQGLISHGEFTYAKAEELIKRLPPSVQESAKKAAHDELFGDRDDDDPLAFVNEVKVQQPEVSNSMTHYFNRARNLCKEITTQQIAAGVGTACLGIGMGVGAWALANNKM